MVILHSLGSLIVGAVPTMILFILLVLAYNALVRRPLEHTLAERRTRTTGAVEQARGAIAAAEAETAVYEGRLRAARAEIAGERDQRQKARQAHRDRALSSTRDQAHGRITAAKNEIEASAEAARQSLEASIDDLGARIVQAILPGGAGLPGDAARTEVRQ